MDENRAIVPECSLHIEHSKELKEISNTLTELKLLYKIQSDENHKLTDSLTRIHSENMQLHREKDVIINDLSRSLTEVTFSIKELTKTQEDITNTVKSLNDSIKKDIEKQDKKIEDLYKKDNISVVGTLRTVITTVLTSSITSGLLYFILKSSK